MSLSIENSFNDIYRKFPNIERATLDSNGAAIYTSDKPLPLHIKVTLVVLSSLIFGTFGYLCAHMGGIPWVGVGAISSGIITTCAFGILLTLAVHKSSKSNQKNRETLKEEQKKWNDQKPEVRQNYKEIIINYRKQQERDAEKQLEHDSCAWSYT